MSDESDLPVNELLGLDQEVLTRLTNEPDAARLLVASFRAQDHETFRQVLEALELVEHCEVVCRWICAKQVVLRCFRLCRVADPDIDLAAVDLKEWADVTRRLTANPDLLGQIVVAYAEDDAKWFTNLLAEFGLEQYCRLVCFWISSTWCELVCRFLCEPNRPNRIISARLVTAELIANGTAVGRLVAQPGAFTRLIDAVDRRDCSAVGQVLSDAGLTERCVWICRWIWVWRCVRVCWRFCGPFPIPDLRRELDEILDFTEAIAQLPPGTLAELADAVERDDADRFAQQIDEFGLAPFCHQVCTWLCRIIAVPFCRCVCRPDRDRPWFTHVGHFHIYSDIDAGSGLANKAILGVGGPDFGFFGGLELRGFCPNESPTNPGVGMRYRFVVDHGGPTPTPITGDLVKGVTVGSRPIMWDYDDGNGLVATFQTIRVQGSGATSPLPTPVPGPLPAHVLTPDSDGWVEVDASVLGGGFSGALMGFESTRLAILAGGDATPPGLAAGQAVPPASQRDGLDLAIVFEATRVGGPSSPPDYRNELSRIRINNWDAVQLLDLLQFHTGAGSPCSELSTDLDIEYTADHELMANWSITITSAASFATGSPLPDGTDSRDGAGTNTAAGTHHEDISAWPSCSYIVWLHTRRRLTTGLVDDHTRHELRTFCKG